MSLARVNRSLTVAYVAVADPRPASLLSKVTAFLKQSWRESMGFGAVERLDDAALRFPQAFSPDGTTLVFEDRAAAGGGGVGVLTLEGNSTVTLVIDGEFDERNPALSPDGRWVAYNSNETGEHQVYVQPFPDVDSGR